MAYLILSSYLGGHQCGFHGYDLRRNGGSGTERRGCEDGELECRDEPARRTPMMDSDTDTSSSEEGHEPWEEASAAIFLDIVRNVVREPGQTYEVDLGNGCRVGASIHVDDGGYVNQVRANFNWLGGVQQGGIQLGDLQQLVGLLEIRHRGGILVIGVREGRVQRREQLRQRRIRLELCRRCGKIHRAGACTGSRPVVARGKRHERQRACPICLEALGAAGGDDVVLRCGHVFHYACVAPWCNRRSTCPVCRTRLEQLD